MTTETPETPATTTETPDEPSLRKARSLLDLTKGWIAVVGAAAVAAGGGISATVGWAKSVGLWGGQLENANKVMAEAHIGDKPTTETVIVDMADDYLVAKAFDNGDVLVHRRFLDSSGNLLRVNRWISKRPIDELLKTSIELSLLNTAHAADLPVSAKDLISERFIGKNAEGYSVYENTWKPLFPVVPSKVTCVVIDEGTGEVVAELPPPCEQYVVPKATE